MKIIGIAGGSGSGKTTLAQLLAEKYPDKIDIITLDKYRNVKEDTSKLPRRNGFIDWDSSETIKRDKFLLDIRTLQNGKAVTIDIWTLGNDPLKNPEYKIIKSRTIYPRDILIVEGYLVLWHEALRKLYSRSYFLQVEQETRLKRRDRAIDPVYDEAIHIPMHNKYVEPTKKFADVTIDVSELSEEEVFGKIVQDLKKSHLLA